MQKHLAILAATLSLMPLGAMATVPELSLGSASYGVGLSTGASLPSDPCSKSLSGSLGITSACASGGGDSSASGIATAGKGFVKAISTVDATASSPSNGSRGGSATANASFSEQLAFLGQANATGHLTGLLLVDGQVGASVSGSSLSSTSAAANFQLTGSFFGQNFNQQANVGKGTNGYDEHSVPLFGVAIPIDVTFTFDSNGVARGSFSLNLQTQASAFAAGYQETSLSPYVSGHASATSAFGHTVYWGGISSFQINGQESTNYTVLSASGLDYRVAAAVPEPDTLAMLLCGLAVVAGAARRRRNMG